LTKPAIQARKYEDKRRTFLTDALLIALLVGIGLQLAASLALFMRQGGDRDAAERLERRLKEDLAASREESARSARGLRDEVAGTLKNLAELQKTTLDGLAGQMARLGQVVEQRLAKLQEDNGAKLEQMRQTVDEKLQGTLEKRLGESFRLVSERLELVHKGLGEMQSLALGVGDLKKVLTNVKTRGIWGEVQLGNLLEQMLTPDQYAANVACRPGSADRVEYVVRLPGRGEGDEEVWLPIDAKFPREDYERLLEAADRADAEAVELAGKALEARVRLFAKEVAQKYIHPPQTTDFAILFLPTEGLYAELLRRPGVAEQMQREYRINLCGPTTLGALLNSLQMGFRSLAIQKRSSEVWQVLGAVKTEFGKYGEVLEKVQKKLVEASNQIEDISVRKRAIDRKLRSVDALDAVRPNCFWVTPIPTNHPSSRDTCSCSYPCHPRAGGDPGGSAVLSARTF
jgi:DNA recombination protein RmuC